MEIGLVPKSEKDMEFAKAFKNKGVNVKVIDRNFLFADFDESFLGYFDRPAEFDKLMENFGEYEKNYKKYGVNLPDFDLIFLRCNEFLTEKHGFAKNVIELVESEGIRVINSTKAVKLSKNKFLAYYYLKKNGIKIPKTFVSNDPVRAYFKMSEYREKLVIKPVKGKGGVGIVITDDLSTAGDVMSLYGLTEKVPIAQEFIENKRDMRIIVLGGEVLGGIYRIAKEGMRKNCISMGGEAKAFKVEGELAEIAVKSAETLGCEIGGVDVIESSGEFFVLEVNSSPSFKGFQKATKIDAYDKIADYLIRECRT